MPIDVNCAAAANQSRWNFRCSTCWCLCCCIATGWSARPTIAKVGHGHIVSDSTLSSRLYAARAAAGDSGMAQLVTRTIARNGLRFVAVVTEEDVAVVPPAGDLLLLLRAYACA